MEPCTSKEGFCSLEILRNGGRFGGPIEGCAQGFFQRETTVNFRNCSRSSCNY